MTIKPRDLPRFPDYTPGMTDHDYMLSCRDMAPLMRDKYGIITAFSMADMLEINDDRWTRQVELEGMRASGVSSGPMFDFVSDVLLFSNGQTHRNRRTPLARSFAQPVVAAMRDEVRERAEKLIAPLVHTGRVEFVSAVCSPLPARIIASIVGAPEEDADRFGAHVYSAIRGLAICSDEVRAESDADMAILADYIADLIAKRRNAPQEDFLSAYLARVEGGPMSETEIRAQIVGLVLAGSDTTRASLAATVSQLLLHPDQWALLIEDPETHAPGAVSEGLRFDPVIGSMARITTEPREFQGCVLPEGILVAASMLTALRDPEIYANPDSFDITRTDHPRLHPVFGGGPHRCLGEMLARIELEEALKALARLAPELALDGPPAYLRGRAATRTVGEMHVRF